LQVRQGANGIGKDDAAMIESLLEFRGCLPTPPCLKVRLAPDISRIEPSELDKERRSGHGEVVRNRCLKAFDRVQRLLPGKRE
jgi:hypothetical protein